MRAPQPQIQTTKPYPWPHDASLSPKTTALLIVDMQRDFLSTNGFLSTLPLSSDCPSPSKLQPLIPRLVSLLSTFRHASFPIVHTRLGHPPDKSTVTSREQHRSLTHGAEIGASGPLGAYLIRGERGHDIISELQPLPCESVIDHTGFNAFMHSELECILRAKGIKNLVVCGVMAEGSVGCTVRGAAERGFDVCVLEDGVEGWVDDVGGGGMWKYCSMAVMRWWGGAFGVTGTAKEVLGAVESWMHVGNGSYTNGR